MSGTPTILVWTWRKGRRFPTKGAAMAKLKVWKRWYERQGWRVIGNGAMGYIAYAPDFDPLVDAGHVFTGEPNPKVHSAGVRPDNGRYLTTAEIDAKLSS